VDVILAAAIRRLGSPQVVLAGWPRDRGGHMGVQVAARLDLPHLAGVLEVRELRSDRLVARLDLDTTHAVAEAPLPVLLAVSGEAPPVRPPAARRVMRWKRQPGPERWSVEELGLTDPSPAGTRILREQTLVVDGAGPSRVEPTEAGIRQLVDRLVLESWIT
jgi:electron transfer flavoprotein alpha/beta subunit